MRDASEVIAEMERVSCDGGLTMARLNDWIMRLRRAAAEPADAGRDANALIRAIAADSTWRTNDNTLWPRITEYIRTARPPSEAAAVDDAVYTDEEVAEAMEVLRGRHGSTALIDEVLDDMERVLTAALASQQAVKP